MIRQKLFRFVEFYPDKFLVVELIALEYQLDNYILDVYSNNQFSKIMGVSRLTKKLAQLKKHRVYPLVYLFIKLTLLLFVSTARESICNRCKSPQHTQQQGKAISLI